MADHDDEQRWQGELFRLLVENVKDYAIFIIDPQGTVLTWSRGAERLTGFPEGEVLGQSFARLFTPEDIAAGEPHREMDQALRLGRGEDDRWHVRKDGSRFWCSGVLTPLRDPAGGLFGYAKIMRDLTAQKLHEEYRRESEERFHLMVEGVREYAIFMLDPGGHVITWNVGAERIKGYRADEIVGRHFSAFYTPEDRTAGKPARGLATAVDEGVYKEEGWRLRKDGTRFFADVTLTALRDEKGKLRGFGKVTRDVTERKRYEDELREANRRKDEFLAMLAHELRGPLAPIRNSLHLLRLDPARTPTELHVADTLDRQVTHLARLVDDLLDVARITRGKVQLRVERVTLAAVLEQAVADTRPVIDARRHGLAVELPGEAVWLEGDPTRLVQVFTNLLTNAAKYTEPGGRITLAAEREGSQAVVRVRDTGVGIPVELLPRVFDLFVQADRSLDRSQGGLGIGLTLVRNLVLLHQGAVEAHSDGPGRGSEFVVRLPAVPEVAPLAPEAAPPRVGPAGRPLRLLVVDDNTDTAESLGMLLRLYGHEVRVANTGPAALAALAEFPAEAVLLDIGLPGLDGYQVARRIRERPECAAVPLIAMTGYGQEADRQRTRAAGFDHHLVKPVDPARLQRLLAAL